MTSGSYRTQSNVPVHPGPELGQGASANVYAAGPDRAVKIYRSPPPPKRLQYLESKLDVMVRLGPPSAGGIFIAWPAGLVYCNRTGRIAGYVMPRMPGCYRPAKLVQQTEQADTAVRNLQQALAEIHRQGLVVGDINGSNVQVGPAGEIALLDADSWQIRDRGRLYHAEGGTAGFTHPLLAAQNAGNRPCARNYCPQQGYSHVESVSCRPRSPASDRYAAARLSRVIKRSGTPAARESATVPAPRPRRTRKSGLPPQRRPKAKIMPS